MTYADGDVEDYTREELDAILVPDINAEVPLSAECMAQAKAWVELHETVRQGALVGQVLWAPPAAGQPWVKVKVISFLPGNEFEYMIKYLVVCNEAGTTDDAVGMHNIGISDGEAGSCKGSSSAPAAPVQGACDLWDNKAHVRRQFPRGHAHVIEDYSENGEFIVKREHQSRYYQTHSYTLFGG